MILSFLKHDVVCLISANELIDFMQYTYDILLNCTLETYITLLTNVTPNKFNLRSHRPGTITQRVTKWCFYPEFYFFFFFTSFLVS